MKINLCCPECGFENWSKPSEKNDAGLFRCDRCGTVSAPEDMSAVADDSFGHVRWMDEDIKSALADMGVRATKKNVAQVRADCENNHHFTDGMIEAGWDTLHDVVFERFRRKNLIQ